MRRAGVGALIVVEALLVVAPMDASEYLVGFVDQAQVERRRLAQPLEAALAAGVLAPGNEDARRRDIHVAIGGFQRLHAEQFAQFVLPLAEQRPRHDDEHSALAFGQQLRDDQPRLNGLAEAHFVRKDAAAFGDAPQRERYGFDLMRVRVHTAAPLRRHVAASLVCAPQADEVLGVETAMDRMQGDASTFWFGAERSRRQATPSAMIYRRRDDRAAVDARRRLRVAAAVHEAGLFKVYPTGLQETLGCACTNSARSSRR